MGTALIRCLGRLLPRKIATRCSGDVAELRLTGAKAAREIAGLVLRRSLPLVALAMITVAALPLFAVFSLRLWRGYDLYIWILRNYAYIDPGILEQTGLTLQRGIPVLLLNSTLMGFWMWTSGVAFASLARHGRWISTRQAAAIACLTVALIAVSGWSRTHYVLSALYLTATALASRRHA